MSFVWAIGHCLSVQCASTLYFCGKMLKSVSTVNGDFTAEWCRQGHSKGARQSQSQQCTSYVKNVTTRSCSHGTTFQEFFVDGDGLL